MTEAAAEVGITRAGIHKAIKAGRLSATKNNNGEWQIDPAELFRVYQPVSKQDLHVAIESPSTTDYELMAQKLEFTQELLRQVQDERDNLRRSLNQAMTLITHQPPPPQPTESPLLKKLFGRQLSK